MFEYNADGERVQKANKGVTTEYTLHGKLITHLKQGANEMHFYYDAQNRPAMVNFNGAYYMYLHNLQGDVVGLVDSSNNLVVEYKYDAWGRPTLKRSLTTAYDTLATLNPFRYRGYVYDEETGLYYVSSRYYDPEIGRWINTDTTDVLEAKGDLNDRNLFAYCDNNPVMRVDHGGEFWDTIFDVVSLVASVAEVIVNPTSGAAWAGLAADVVCTIVPGLTGGGAIVKAITKADNVVDTAKSIYKAADKASDIRRATGSYAIAYKSGKNYIGTLDRVLAIKSAQRNATKYSDEVASISWKSAPNNRTAFIDEYQSMCRYGGPNNRAIGNASSYNQIWSPGRNYYHSDHGSYYQYGGRFW